MSRNKGLGSISGFSTDVHSLKWNPLAAVQPSLHPRTLPGATAPFNTAKVLGWNTFISLAETQGQRLSSLGFSCSFVAEYPSILGKYSGYFLLILF